jgi:hypothetical protein
MTQKEFTKVLKKNGHTYELVDNKVIVTSPNITLYLDTLTEIPSGIIFNNGGFVDLSSLVEIPSDIEFNNAGHVMLKSLRDLPPSIKFNNRGHVWLNSLGRIPYNLLNLDNIKDIYLGPLFGGWISGWEGNIRGVESKRLLNLMSSKEMFI